MLISATGHGVLATLVQILGPSGQLYTLASGEHTPLVLPSYDWNARLAGAIPYAYLRIPLNGISTESPGPDALLGIETRHTTDRTNFSTTGGSGLEVPSLTGEYGGICPATSRGCG